TAKLGDILIEIGQFIKSAPQEKVIVHIRKAKDSPNEMNWSILHQLLNLNFTSLLIPKSQSNSPLKDMKGNVALIAPAELILENDKNWGPESLSAYISPEILGTTVEFHNWIEDVCIEYLEKPDKSGALAWVECNFKDYKLKL
ncbi:hypothetical protein, partial [Salmonella sp. s51228]|uniref:hypothetical protein n=1 Tax=Salmonella sp. s51228 TaxID=3159652 RepID=UPI0039818C81